MVIGVCYYTNSINAIIPNDFHAKNINPLYPLYLDSTQEYIIPKYEYSTIVQNIPFWTIISQFKAEDYISRYIFFIDDVDDVRLSHAIFYLKGGSFSSLSLSRIF